MTSKRYLFRYSGVVEVRIAQELGPGGYYTHVIYPPSGERVDVPMTTASGGPEAQRNWIDVVAAQAIALSRYRAHAEHRAGYRLADWRKYVIAQRRPS